MKALLSVHIALLLFVIVRAGDLALSYVGTRRAGNQEQGFSRSLLWAILYGIAALFALLILVLVLLGIIGGG